MQTHKGSHHVPQKKLFHNLFSSNKFSHFFLNFPNFYLTLCPTVLTSMCCRMLRSTGLCWCWLRVRTLGQICNEKTRGWWAPWYVLIPVLRWLWLIKKNLNLEVVDTPHWHLSPPPIWRWSGRPQLQSQVLPKREKQEIWSAQVTMVNNGWRVTMVNSAQVTTMHCNG